MIFILVVHSNFMAIDKTSVHFPTSLDSGLADRSLGCQFIVITEADQLI